MAVIYKYKCQGIKITILLSILVINQLALLGINMTVPLLTPMIERIKLVTTKQVIIMLQTQTVLNMINLSILNPLMLSNINNRKVLKE